MFFHLRVDDGLPLGAISLTPRFFPPRTRMCGLQLKLASRVVRHPVGRPRSSVENVGAPCLSLMRVSMKNFFSGSSGFSFRF